MRYLILTILPFLSIFLQSTFFSNYSIKGTVPDLVLVFVVFFALLNGAGKGTTYALLCGLLEDLYIGRFIGLNVISKGLTAYIVGKLQGNVFKEYLLVGVAGVIIGSIINNVLLLILSIATFEVFNFDQSILIGIFYQTFYNTMISAPLYIWYYRSHNMGLLRGAGKY